MMNSVRTSATMAGLSTPSISTVISLVASQRPGPFSRTSVRRVLPRILLSTFTGSRNRTRSTLGLVDARDVYKRGLMTKDGGHEAMDHYFHQISLPERHREKVAAGEDENAGGET